MGRRAPEYRACERGLSLRWRLPPRRTSLNSLIQQQQTYMHSICTVWCAAAVDAAAVGAVGAAGAAAAAATAAAAAAAVERIWLISKTKKKNRI